MFSHVLVFKPHQKTDGNIDIDMYLNLQWERETWAPQSSVHAAVRRGWWRRYQGWKVAVPDPTTTLGTDGRAEHPRRLGQLCSSSPYGVGEGVGMARRRAACWCLAPARKMESLSHYLLFPVVGDAATRGPDLIGTALLPAHHCCCGRPLVAVRHRYRGLQKRCTILYGRQRYYIAKYYLLVINKAHITYLDLHRSLIHGLRYYISWHI
jgi:hypothetical protein